MNEPDNIVHRSPTSVAGQEAILFLSGDKFEVVISQVDRFGNRYFLTYSDMPIVSGMKEDALKKMFKDLKR